MDSIVGHGKRFLRYGTRGAVFALTRVFAVALARVFVVALTTLVVVFVGCDDGGGSDGEVDSSPPGQVTGVVENRSDDATTVVLSWVNPLDVDIATVRVTVTPELPRFPLDIQSFGPRAEQSHTIRGLFPDEVYTFFFTTVDIAGNESALSDAPSVVALSDSASPSVVSGVRVAFASDSTDTLILSWVNPTDSDLAHIRLTWTPVDIDIEQPREIPVTGESDTLSLSGLTPGTVHAFEFKAVDDAGNTGEAVSISVTTIASGFTAIGAGDAHTCALRNGVVYCWGDRTNGKIGDATIAAEQERIPRKITNFLGRGVTLLGVYDLSVGENHACAIAGIDRTAYCWGVGGNGRLGGGSVGNNGRPSAVLSGEALVGTNLTGVHAIDAGAQHTCAIAGADRAAYCWGEGRWLGSGTADGATTPVSVSSGAAGSSGTGLTGVHAIAAGARHTCAIAGTNRTVYCWGDQGSEALGDNTIHRGIHAMPVAALVPFANSPLSGATAIVAGAQHTCAIANGIPYCWGRGGSGVLGNSSTLNRGLPGVVVSPGEMRDPPSFGVQDTRPILAAVTSFGVTVGRDLTGPRSCAVAGADANVYCWGENTFALSANAVESGVDRLTPALITGVVGGNGRVSSSEMISGAVAVAAGSLHTCAVSPTAAYCWGNERGGVGFGSIVIHDRGFPVNITGNFPE